jgi:hypothetical protein
MIRIQTNIINTRALTRVWLRTTDRNTPLRSIWVAAATRPTPTVKEGTPLCA